MLAILGKHIDALYVSVYLDIPQHALNLFAAFKEQARESEDDMEEFHNFEEIPGGMWYVRPYGNGKYQYVLENASFWMAVTTWKNLPTIKLQFKAATLYEYEADQLPMIVGRLVRAFFGESIEFRTVVSRLDVAVDFQEESFEIPDMRDVITRARDRTVNYRGSSPHALTLGKYGGALQAQIYCKSMELEHSQKDWMLDVWRASGRYRESLSVYRVELRYFREGLRAFDVTEILELLGSIGDLATYAVGHGNGSWLRIADEHTRGNQSQTRPVATWWGHISNALCYWMPCGGRKRKRFDPLPSYTRAVELAGAHMARAASLARAGGWSKALCPSLFAKDLGEQYRQRLEHRGLSWADKVNQKTAELRTVAW